MNILRSFWNWLTGKNKKKLVIETQTDVVGRYSNVVHTNQRVSNLYPSRIVNVTPVSTVSNTGADYNRIYRDDNIGFVHPPIIVGDTPIWIPEKSSGGFGKSDSGFTTGGTMGDSGSFRTGGGMSDYSSSYSSGGDSGGGSDSGGGGGGGGGGD